MGPGFELFPAGVDHAVDQVVRLDAFRRAHPEWRVWSDEAGLWRALRLTGGGETKHAFYELRDLLDALGAS